MCFQSYFFMELYFSIFTGFMNVKRVCVCMCWDNDKNLKTQILNFKCHVQKCQNIYICQNIYKKQEISQKNRF